MRYVPYFMMRKEERGLMGRVIDIQNIDLYIPPLKTSSGLLG
jgi:hypothetical protein